MAKMPAQKPGNSKQDWQTPPELLQAVKNRLHIAEFDIDVAASEENKVCPAFYSKEMNGLTKSWVTPGWVWCNPPYEDITPWVKKAANEARCGASTAVLIPLSLAEWWVNWVEPYAYKLLLHGRVKFVGAEQGYPKDCAVLLYTPWRAKGTEVWDWRQGN